MREIPLVCPKCLGVLDTMADQLICPTCERVFPRTLSIPDLCDPETCCAPVEKAAVARLEESFFTAGVEELNQIRLSTYRDFANIDKELPYHYAHYSASVQARGRRFYSMFRRAVAELHSLPSSGTALDVGCGTGAGIIPMAAEFRQVVGLDIRMSSLIVAKKLVERHRLSNVTLVRGSALCMPFPNSLFDYITAINVLEHIFDPAAMLREIRRVLGEGGAFAGDSRNRFDLLFPEPHARLRFVGFLPRRWMGRYVRWRRGMSYETTHLLSYADLHRALATVFGPGEWEVMIPDVTTYGFSLWLERLVTKASQYGLLRNLLIRLSPTHLAVARCAD